MKRDKYILSDFQRYILEDIFTLKSMTAICIIVILVVGIRNGIKVDQVCKQQIDILDQINYHRQATEPAETAESSIAQPADPVSVHTLTPDERDLVCRVVAAEARGEDLQGKMAVAQTILDRSELWNQSVTKVVTAPGQYAAPYQGKISDEVYLAVADVFDGGIRAFDQPITHFAENGVDPSWSDGKTCRGSIGRHTFWY